MPRFADPEQGDRRTRGRARRVITADTARTKPRLPTRRPVCIIERSHRSNDCRIGMPYVEGTASGCSQRSSGTGLLVTVALLGVIVAGCASPREASDDGGTEGERVRRVYHVQIRMTEHKAVADRTMGAAMAWWRERSAAERPRTLAGMDTLPVTIAWRPPLYRVRVGPFASRSRAEALLGVIDAAYPDAFIAPQRVQARHHTPADNRPRPVVHRFRHGGPPHP